MSVVVDALVRIAGAAPGSTACKGWDQTDSASVEVLSYSGDFDALWGLSSRRQASSATLETALFPYTIGLRSVASSLIGSRPGRLIIVVWDGLPVLDTGPVDTTRYLTPVDWAIALALEVEAQISTESVDWRLWILDCGGYRSLHAGTTRFIEDLPDRQVPLIPWLRIVRISEIDPVASILTLIHALQQARDKVDVASAHRNTGFAQKSGGGSRLDPLRAIWSAGSSGFLVG